MAKVTLRRAQKVRGKVTAYLETQSVSAPTKVILSVFNPEHMADPSKIVDAACNTLGAWNAEFAGVSDMLCNIRYWIDRANGDAGISERLARLNHLDRVIQVLESQVVGSPTDTSTLLARLQAMHRRIEGAAAAPSSGFGRDADALSVGVMTLDGHKATTARIAELKRDRENLNDEILVLNAETSIEIPDDYLALLTKLQII